MLAYPRHIMTLANSIIGVGILAMPFCFQKCGIVLSILLLIISNWITRISCHYLIKSSLLTRRKSLEFLGFHAFGSSGKLLAELCIIGYLFGTSITYFVVMGDLGPQIASKLFSLETADFPHLRTWVMIAVTLFCILPLAMLKNVDSLSTVCAASIGFYVCLVVKIVLESEEHIAAYDWVERVEYWRPAGILQCLPIFSMALSCQMQLFEVFQSINNQSVEKLNGIVRSATWICTFVYIAVGFFGYVAFCTNIFSGNILMNFSHSFGSDVIKIGFVLSVAFSFPLVVFPCRASIYSLLYRKGHTDTSGYIPENRFKVITICLVGCALCIALMIPSVELIIGLVGSTIGVAICIMFPAVCFRKIVKKDSTERSLAQFIFISGFCLMILGTYANLNAIDERRSGAHVHIAEESEDTNLVRPIEKRPDLLRNATPVQLIPPLLLDDINVEKGKTNAYRIAEKEDKGLKVISHKSVVLAQAELKASGSEVHKVDDNLKQKGEQPAPSNLKPLHSVSLQNQDPPQQQNIPPNLQQKSQQNKQQQAIDKEAIKKDEEIAAEEFKNGQRPPKSSNDIELKETRKELKKTKELLERTVDELKQELAKQNEETQNLVAEKLEEVVQKVEQIEKQVQHKEPAQAPLLDNKDTNGSLSQVPNNVPKEGVMLSKTKEDSPKRPQIKNHPEESPSLLNIISEEPAELRAQKQVYEPLSYKTGELIEHLKNDSKLDQRLPLPLAVLFHASNNKSNPHIRDVADQTLNVSLHAADNTSFPINIKTENSKKLKSNDPPVANIAQAPSENDKDNVEAIRRDILQLKSKQLNEFPPSAAAASVVENNADIAAPNVNHLRQKRSNIQLLKTPDFEAIDEKSQSNNCLTELKADQLLAHGGISNAINFQMQNIGRELRSVRDDSDVKD